MEFKKGREMLRGGWHFYGKRILAVAALLGVGGIIRASMKDRDAVSLADRCPDPFSESGVALVALSAPLSTFWSPMQGSTCPPAPDYLTALWHIVHGRDHPPPEHDIQSMKSGQRGLMFLIPEPDDHFNPPEPPPTIPERIRPAVEKANDIAHHLPIPGHGKGKSHGDGVEEETNSSVYSSYSPRGYPPAPLLPIVPERHKIMRSLRRRTVMMLGDSVDRNTVVQLCQLLSLPTEIRHYRDELASTSPPSLSANPSRSSPQDTHGRPFQPHRLPSHGPPHEGWDQKSLAHVCRVPKVDLRMFNAYHYGVQQDDLGVGYGSEWHAPGAIEDRIDQLFVPLSKRILREAGRQKLDLIILHSAMWDLALFSVHGAADPDRGERPEALSPEQLSWWQGRMSETIEKVRKTWPGVPIVFRQLHRVGGGARSSQFVTDLRLHQLRHLGTQVARSHRLPVIDLSHLIEGYQTDFQETVHPTINPGGVLLNQNILTWLVKAVGGPGVIGPSDERRREVWLRNAVATEHLGIEAEIGKGKGRKGKWHWDWVDGPEHAKSGDVVGGRRLKDEEGAGGRKGDLRLEVTTSNGSFRH